MTYYISINGRVVGPMSAQQMMAYNVNENTQVSTDGYNWQPLFAFPELMTTFRSSKAGSLDSTRILFGIFAIFLGTLGVQYFIIGKVKAGIFTILISLVTCGVWEIITLIQGILVLFMSDDEFNRKYVETPNTFPLF
ncbi:MAG: GYF domain-containing protein [Muribaculaceae bacterium]|nr:GYF domain-containing protein [Muribaculaceae bacterium]